MFSAGTAEGFVVLAAALAVGAVADKDAAGRREVRLVFAAGALAAGAFATGAFVTRVLTGSLGAAGFEATVAGLGAFTA